MKIVFNEEKLKELRGGLKGLGLVVRQYNGRIVVASKSQRKIKPTPAMTRVRGNFKVAAAYAREAMSDPELREIYAKQVKSKLFKNAYTAAVTDYLRLPEICSVDLLGYSGKAKDVIEIRVRDEFKIISVYVSIVAADNQTIETGYATYAEGTLRWRYVAKTTTGTAPGTKISVTVEDRPGKTVTDEIVL